LLHLAGRLADRLDHERDRALVRIEVGERQRNALALLVLHHDDELSCARRLRHQRMADVQLIGDVGVVLAVDDLEIGHAPFPRSAGPGFHATLVPPPA
jgi:hypothetical protein